MSSVVIQDYISGISSCIMLNCVVLAVCLPNIGMCLLSRACELTLLRPLWRLFMSMEHSLSQDPSSITVLLPLHRALSELFFIAEARAVVSDTHTHTQRHTVRTCRPCLFEWDRSSGLWLLVGVCLASWVEGFFFFVCFSLLCWQHCWLFGWWWQYVCLHIFLSVYCSVFIHILIGNHQYDSTAQIISFSIIASRSRWEPFLHHTPVLLWVWAKAGPAICQAAPHWLRAAERFPLCLSCFE